MVARGWLPLTAMGLGLLECVAPASAEPPKTAPRKPEASPELPSGNLLYEIQNPFAFIPRLPIENQFGVGSGETQAVSYELSVRPIIPFNLSEDLALITRTTVRMIYEGARVQGGPAQAGFGDIDQEFFFSPDNALDGQWIMGVGPIIRWPTATTHEFGGQLWGMGPAAAVIWQPAGVEASSGWTFMLITHHLFDIAGRGDHGSLSFTYLMPEASYTTEGGTNFILDTQPVYDWIVDDWIVPIHFSVSQLLQPGGQPLVLTLGGQYFARRAIDGPEWGGQFSVNFLFPE